MFKRLFYALYHSLVFLLQTIGRNTFCLHLFKNIFFPENKTVNAALTIYLLKSTQTGRLIISIKKPTPMSKLILFFVLLITLTSSAQEIVPVKATETTPLVWDEQDPFVNGFARVLQKNKFSFINKAGVLISPLEFDAARNFNNHLAAVKKGDKWGFINESGKMVIPFSYDIVFDFNAPVTGVFGNKRWWLINTQAQITKALDINIFYGFKNGIAKIEKNERTGTINLNGEIAFSKEQNIPAFKSPIPYHTSSANTMSSSITVCPDNIDFEYGSFFNWQCFIGHVDSIVNVNVITLNPSPPTPNRHTLYNRVTPSAIDPYGLFPTNPPDGSNFALRLGNTVIGGEAEGATYVIHVPLNDSNFSIKYDYAVVFEDPGHTIWSQPRFQVKVFDSAANAYVDCASFEYISTSGLPGFTRSTVDTGVIFKPWSSVFLSLRGYAGKTMYLEFKNADCVRKGHWGYSYIDVEKPCGQSVEMDYDCAPPHITTLNAPPGFQFYNWWDSAFTTILATGQNAVLNPGPTINTTIWLEMIPFNNFGCLDTIPIKITGEFKAHFDLSDTLGLCAPHTFTFYNRDIPSTSAIWDFGDGTTGSGDTVTHTYALPGSYIVKLDVLLPGGCRGAVQKLVAVVQPTGSFSFAGGSFCNSRTVQFDAITANADSLIWNFDDGTIVRTSAAQTTITHTYNTAGIFHPLLTIKTLGGCERPVPATDTIKIEILDPGFINNLVTVCGSTTINVTDTSHAFFGISSRQWDFGDGGTGSGINVSHTYTTTGTYNVRLIITGITGCKDTVIKPIYVKVNDRPVSSITGPITACQSASVTFNSVVSSTDPINYYHWTSSNGYSGNTANFSVIFPQPGIDTIQLIVRTVNGCADTSIHYITINPTPDVVQPPNQVLCNGDFTSTINFSGSIPGTIYNWTNTAPLIGLAASGSGDIASFQASSNGNSVANAGIRVTPVANGCPGAQKLFVITVHPTPSVAQVADQTLCDNSNTTAINFTGPVAGTVYNWTNNNTTIGLAASGSGNIPSFTANSNGNTVNTATITVTPMVNNCPGTPKIFTITVNPVPDVVQPADQTLCNNSNTIAINFTGPVAGTVYNWTNNNATIGLGATGSGNIPSFAASSNGASVNTATITVTPSVNGCSAPSKTFTITVNPTANVIQPANQVLCDNSNTAAIIFNGAVTGTTYNWTNNNTTIGLAAGGSGDIPSFVANSNGVNTATATITVTPTVNGCPGLPKTFTITVNPVPDVLQPADQVLCNNSSTAAINFSGAVNGTTYNWTNNNPAIGLAANGSGNIPSFVISNAVTSTVTATITVSPVINGCPGMPKTFTITVNPVPDVIQPANQTLCNNSNTAIINFSGAVSGATYNWTNSNTAIGLAASGSGNIPSFIATSNGASTATATITVTPTMNGCPGTPKTFTIIVNPVPDVVQPADQTLCNNSNTAAIVFSGAVSGTTYNWTNNNPSIGLAASGSGNIPSFVISNAVTSTVTATITVSPVINGCPGTPKTFTITVNPVPNVVQTPNQTLCNNSNTAPINFSGAVNNAVYNWTNNNPSIGLASIGSGNIPSFTVLSNGANTNTATIIVTPTFNGCPGTPKTFTIIVNPMPDMAQPADQALCSGNFTAPINFTGAVAGTVYTWTNTAPSIGLAASGSGNIPSFQAVTTNASVTNATITVSIAANGCNAPSKTFMIAVNATPNVVQPGDQSVCNGAVINAINFSGNVPGAVYKWTNNNTLIGLPASGTGDIASFTAVNKTNAPIKATITVLPTTTDCSGTAKVFDITINPTPSVAADRDAIVCLGNTVQLNATGAAQYTWSPVDHLTCSTCPDPVSQPVDSIVYTVKGTSAAGCIAYDSVVLNVIKPFKMQVGPGDTLCIGDMANLSAFNAKTYLWSPATNLSGANTANPLAKPSVTTRFQVIGYDGHNCFTDTGYVLITVGPRPKVNLGADRTLSTGTLLTLNAITQNGPIINYSWTPAQELSCNNCQSPTTIVKNNSFFAVEVTNIFGCKASDTLIINPICKSAQVFIPNAFTPDGDGLNDILMVRGQGITIKSFRIFNRWGELVFEKENFSPNDPKYGWDGKVRGIPATPDVFVYTAEVFCDNGVPYTYKGNVTVLK
jgi:gliding motility-associated-like protein